MRPIDLPPADLDTVRRILRDHAPGVEARAFGSRVSWTARDTSDLDLVLMTESPLDAGRMAALRAAFTGSNLPFRVDVADWAAVSEDFRAIIEREYAPISPADTRPAKRRWKRTTLGDCIEINDDTYSPRERWHFVNYLDTGSITENRISKIQHLVDGRDKIPTRARRRARQGDIVYSTVRPNQRHYGVLREIPENFLASTGFSVLRGRKGVAFTDFIYWFLARNETVQYLQSVAEQSKAAYPAINPIDIERLPIDLPPLAEQRAIAEILGALDDKIELNRRMNETLEAMARAIFDDWFVDFGPVRAKIRGQKSGLPKTLSRLFPDKLAESQTGPIPKGWKMSRMDDIFEISSGKTLPVDMRYNDGTYRAFGANGPICKTEKPSVNSACVILGKIGSCGALHRSPSPCWVTNNAFAIREGKSGSLEYVWHTLKRIDFSKYVGGSGNPYMPLQNFGHHLVLLPPSRVCSAYQKIAGNLRERIDCNNFQSDILSAIRDALLPDLMSGRIPVSNFR